jgi:hypothetical protein
MSEERGVYWVGGYPRENVWKQIENVDMTNWSGFSVDAPVGSYERKAQVGWMCPECGRVWSPYIRECWRCNV